jgi:hypothetical protein
LKLGYDEPLSRFAFKFNLRRCHMVLRLGWLLTRMDVTMNLPHTRRGIGRPLQVEPMQVVLKARGERDRNARLQRLELSAWD